jgi:hypothetical protein
MRSWCRASTPSTSSRPRPFARRKGAAGHATIYGKTALTDVIDALGDTKTNSNPALLQLHQILRQGRIERPPSNVKSKVCGKTNSSKTSIPTPPLAKSYTTQSTTELSPNKSLAFFSMAVRTNLRRSCKVFSINHVK